MWAWRGIAAVWAAGIALFTVIFAMGQGLGGPVLIFGAAAGSAAAGALLAPQFGRRGGLGWLWASGAAVMITVIGGAVAGAVFDPALRHGGPLTGAVIGPAMVMFHPLPALVWLGGFGGLHLCGRRWREAKMARDRLRVFEG